MAEKTTLKFIPDPFSQDPNARLYKTGDMVRYLPDGNLEFIGRTDFQVKIRGFRIELSEIELFLEQHEAVQQAIAIAHESVLGEKSLVAYWIAKPGQTASAAVLHPFLLERLPHYMMPSAFIQLDSFPLTPNGKVDRQALPQPQRKESDRPQAIVQPRTQTEVRLIQIWENLFDDQPIGIRDDFFELGGHSLRVARLFDQIEAQFNCSLPLTTIFNAPTIEQLAQQIEVVSQAPVHDYEHPAVVKLRGGTADPPLFLVIAFPEDTQMYLNLAQAFGDNTLQDGSGDRPIYGLRPYDANHRFIPFTRIPQAAKFLIEQMQNVQPQGPYLLGGQCGGGTIAFEMAQQLQRRGETVALVALLDTADVTAQPTQKQQPAWFSRFQLGLKALKVKWLLPWVQRYLDHQLPFSQWVVQRLSPLRRLQYWGDRQLPLPEADPSICPFVLFDFAFENYQPQGVFTGNLVLLRATEGNGDPQDEPYINCYADPLLGWGKRVRGMLSVYDVPGGHGSLLTAPYAKFSAKILQSAVQMALSNCR